MLATMFFTQMNTAKKLQGSISSLRNKIYATLSVVFLLLASSFLSHAQVVTASSSPNVICEGNLATITISTPLGLPGGVTVDKNVFYHLGSTAGRDSTVNNSGTQKTVTIPYNPGVYTAYAVAILSNGTRLTSSPITITVYNRPSTQFINITQDTQCFKNNSVCFQNLTVQGPPPSTPVVQYIWEYGDAFIDSVPNTVNVCHNYTFPSTFPVTLRAIDSLDCRRDVVTPAAKPIVIKPNITPEFTWLMRKGPCFISNYLFTNKTPVALADLQSFTWDFGDGKSYTATAPFDLTEMNSYDTIGHDFTINGEFSPLLSITDLTGCTDSIRYTPTNAPKAIPKNIRFEFDIVTTKDATDPSMRDSVCVGSGNSASICFKQTPITFASAGTGDFLWNFGDPMSAQQNFDIISWNPCHTFVGGLGTYYVTLTISNICPTPITFTYHSAATLPDDKYIDKYIYTDNDTLDTKSRPVFFTDTIIKPNVQDPLYTLTYTGKYIMSGTPYRSDTLYIYKGKQERPLYYISTDTLVFKAVGVVRDTIILPTNFVYLQPRVLPLPPDTFKGYGLYGYGVRILGPAAAIPAPPAGVIIKPSQANQCGPTDTVDFVNTSQYYKSRKMYRKWDFGDDFAPQCTSFSKPKYYLNASLDTVRPYPPYMAYVPTAPNPPNPSGLAIRYLDSITYDNGKTWVKYPNVVYKTAYATFGVIVDTLRAWTSAIDQYNFSDHYFIANKQVYPGKMNCKFSYDTLPRHHYPNWDSVYRWHISGKDFMPWDPLTYGSGAGLIPIHPADAMWWGNPVFLNPSTGEWSLTQGTGPAPYGLWVRIDTIDFNWNNGQDLKDGEPINLRNVPDPWNYATINDKGEYPTISGGQIEPNNTISYRWLDSTYIINGSDIIPGGGNMTFYEYAFLRSVNKCITVTLNLKDSFNNETTQGTLNDSLVFDSVDCRMEATVQLALARADARGLGKSGKECPGANPNKVVFELGGVGNFPGVVPNCGQTFILFNFDSLADRMDNTPCDLDGFMSWTGGWSPWDFTTTPPTPPAPIPGTPTTTPGGRVLPAFWTNPNFTPAPRAWQSPSSTQIVFHYGLNNAPQNVPPPADTAQGWVTVGIVIGSGCKDHILTGIPLTQYENDPAYYQNLYQPPNPAPNVNYGTGNSLVPGAPIQYNYTFSQIKNKRMQQIGPIFVEVVDIEYTDCNWAKCMSDTVWYHRFIRIQNLDAKFFVDPVNCKLRHKGEEIIVHYEDSVQDDIKYSVWDWGDNTLTVDSFYYADTIIDYNNGFFVNGIRRVRYNLDYDSGTPVVMDSTVWPIKAPGGPYVRYYYDSTTNVWTLINSLVPISLTGVANPQGVLNEYRITDTDIPTIPFGSVVRWNGLVWSKRVTIGGTELKQTEGIKVGTVGFVDTVRAKNFERIFIVVSRTAIPGKVIVIDKCSLNLALKFDPNYDPMLLADTMVNADTMEYYPISQIIDTALMFLPIKHTFKRTSWEVARKLPGVRTGNIIHLIGSKRGCTGAFPVPVTIGIVDTFDILNGSGAKDTLFCENEPVYFVDSLRYFRFDCNVTELPFVPAVSKSVAYTGILAPPYDDLQIDSADFWRQDVGDPRPIQNIIPYPNIITPVLPLLPFQGKYVVDTVVAERVYWDFGDGSPIDSSMRPVHAYKSYGRYLVMMYSRDSLGWFDTTYGYLNISKPAAKISYLNDGNGVPVKIFNCDQFATFIDSSFMRIDSSTLLYDPITNTYTPTRKAVDSVKTNYWWFGDNKLDTVKWQTFNNFKPTKPYTNKGLYRVKLVSESYLGCKDTTYDTVFIRGPRPAVRLLNPADTMGCAPFKVRLVNMADSLGKFIDKNGNTNPSDTPTRTTYIDWGDKKSQDPVYGRRDTIEFIYTDSGTFNIFAIGSDAGQGGSNSCPFSYYPDTPNQDVIRITVRKLKREITLDKSIICKDAPVQISNSSDPAYNVYSYVFWNDTVQVDSLGKGQAPSYTFPHSFVDTGFYTIIARPLSVSGMTGPAAENCKIPDTVQVKVVYPAPLFSVDSLDDNNVTTMPKVSLINNSDPAINVSYVWTVTKEGASTPKFPPYTGTNADRDYNFDLADDTGTYDVCLKAFATGLSETEGCVKDTCIKIKSTFVIKFEIPNVFTPNGDGTNDEFKVKTEGIQKYKMIIYNRWGGKVFESGDPKTTWNGKTDNTGAECPAGVYYYICDYQLRTQGDTSRTGSITLIR